jgi:hypothetical protein
MRWMTRFLVLGATLASVTGTTQAAGLDAAVQARIDARVQTVKLWAADPIVVQAVKSANSAPSAEFATMTQDKWAGLTVLDPLVRTFTKNAPAMFLKGKQTEEVSEAFVSSAAGTKVAFLSKTTNWSHKGKPKHELPMTGKVWQGDPETDESTGVQQIQIAVPVMDGGKPIGSLVIGLAVSKLR